MSNQKPLNSQESQSSQDPPNGQELPSSSLGNDSCSLFDGCISSKQTSERVSHTTPPLTINVLPANQLFSGKNIYSMGPGTSRGLALILNYETFDPSWLGTRIGTDVDESYLVDLFTQMGFQVEVAKNLDKKDTLSTILHFSKDKRHRSSNMMILVVLSHGMEADNIFTSDGETINVYEDIVG